MNDIANQNLRPETARVSVVTSKPNVSVNEANKDVSGKLLPLSGKNAATVEKPVVVNTQSRATIAVDKEKIEAAVANMNEYTQSIHRDLHFNLDESSGRTVVQVIDRESKELIRQIPDEVFLKIAGDIKQQLESSFDSQLKDNDVNTFNLINTSV